MKCSKCHSDNSEIVVTRNDFKGSSAYIKCNDCQNRTLNFETSGFGRNGSEPIKYELLEMFKSKEF
jgi:transcriptional regulator NrdR family protein